MNGGIMAELSKLFPCRVGDTIYSFGWNMQNCKYVLLEEKCLGFNVRSDEGYSILLKGEKFEYLRSDEKYRKNWFTFLDEAKTKLELLNQRYHTEEDKKE